MCSSRNWGGVASSVATSNNSTANHACIVSSETDTTSETCINHTASVHTTAIRSESNSANQTTIHHTAAIHTATIQVLCGGGGNQSCNHFHFGEEAVTKTLRLFSA